LASLPTTNLNIRANTNAGPIESVRFGFDGNNNYGVENIAPYALFSDQAGNYHPGTLSVGSHTLSATPFAADNASGSQGVPLSIAFSVSNSAAVTRFKSLDADIDQAIRAIVNGEEINLANLPTTNLNIRAVTNGGSPSSLLAAVDAVFERLSVGASGV
jgi:hypothetical protein